jgi:hypothetical protein
MAKKVKRYAAGDEIVVSGTKPVADSSFNLQNIGYRLPHMDGGGGGGGGGRMGGGGGSSKSSAPKASIGKMSTPVGKVYGLKGIPVGKGSVGFGASPFDGGKIGATASFPFKKGGSIKKMAAGGSAASKRADGCATKGKTKGRFV